MIKYTNKKVIDCSDWDDLVEQTYEKPYCFQQQEGCQSRGTVDLTIPADANDDGFHDSIREVVNGDEMGIKFDVWLARDPKEPLKDEKDGHVDWMIGLFWQRNFYPDLHTVANDLHKKGLIEAGSYVINIDW